MSKVFFLVAAVVCALASCATPPPTPPKPLVATVPPEQRLAAVEAAAGGDDKELAVQPLRDPQVEDLREAAQRARAAHDYTAAAQALNQALLIVADDPAVLQERAEVALLQADYARAVTLAKRALDLGSKVGPLCRRHWATLEQSRLALADVATNAANATEAATQASEAAVAHAQIDGCTVAGFERM